MKTIYTKTLKLNYNGKLLTSEIIGDIEIDVQHVIENHKATAEITEGKKFISLVITAPETSITPAAQQESSTLDKYKHVVAQAIIVHSLAQRILGNFKIKFIKYSFPCQLFSNKEEALAWLNKQWEMAAIEKQKQI